MRSRDARAGIHALLHAGPRSGHAESARSEAIYTCATMTIHDLWGGIMPSRRRWLQSVGGTLTLPLLETDSRADENRRPSGKLRNEADPTPRRFLVVANPLGVHPDHFFPAAFGRQVDLPETLRPLDGLQGRFTVISHTDHNMKSGHGREKSFLSGVLPEAADAYPMKNMSIDQVIARHTGGGVRFPSVHAALKTGIDMVYDASGNVILPHTNETELYDRLFRNRTAEERHRRRETIGNNRSVMDAVAEQFAQVQKQASSVDRRRLDQFSESVRRFESSLVKQSRWVDRDKPQFDLEERLRGDVTIETRYEAIFDMITYAFQTDTTRVATIAFPNELNYTDVPGVTRGYHACTHNGKDPSIVRELVAIESFQIRMLARCLRRLAAIEEPGGQGTMLDHTVVLFGSGMGYGGTHSNRNLPVLVAGGGFQHRGHVDGLQSDGSHLPLCNVFLTILQRFGIEQDRFNLSTGSFDLAWG